jgi:hypothetical protein
MVSPVPRAQCPGSEGYLNERRIQPRSSDPAGACRERTVARRIESKAGLCGPRLPGSTRRGKKIAHDWDEGAVTRNERSPERGDRE